MCSVFGNILVPHLFVVTSKQCTHLCVVQQAVCGIKKYYICIYHYADFMYGV